MRKILLRNTNRFAIGVILLFGLSGFIEEDAFLWALILTIPFGATQVIISLLMIPEIKIMNKKIKYGLFSYYYILIIYAIFFRLLDVILEQIIVSIPFFLALLLTIVLEIHAKKE